jgi:hypothetical protein
MRGNKMKGARTIHGGKSRMQQKLVHKTGMEVPSLRNPILIILRSILKKRGVTMQT